MQPAPAPLSAAARTPTVLLVEDDPLIRLSASEMLKDAGYRVLEAHNGESAVTLLEEAEADVLMTDLNLPGMSGRDLAAHVRLTHPGMRIVFATGEASVSEAGDALLLRKPYVFKDLKAVVEAALAG